MSDWLLALLCLGGYEVVAMITARILYRHVMYDNLEYRSQLGYHTYGKGRHAGKSFWLAQTWGPALIAAPPAAAVAAVCAVGWGLGWLLCAAGRGIGYAAEWFIKTETLSAAQFRPHKVDEGALEAACAQAGRELAEIKGEAVPDDHYEAEMRAREKHAMDLELMRRKIPGHGLGPDIRGMELMRREAVQDRAIVDHRKWHDAPESVPPLRGMPGYTLGGAVDDILELYPEYEANLSPEAQGYEWDMNPQWYEDIGRGF